MDFDILKDLLPKKPNKWTEEDVYIWLKCIEFQNLSDKFQENWIDGRALLTLTNRDLKSRLEIESSIQRKKLFRWIEVGLPQYGRYLEENDLIKDDIVSQRSSIFSSKRYFNEQITQLSSQTLTIMDEDKEHLSQTNKNAFKKPQVDSDLKQSVKKDRSSQKIIQRELIIQDLQKKSCQCFCLVNRGGTIGKSLDNEILIIDSQIKPVHCEITFEKQDFFLQPSDENCEVWFKIKGKLTLKNGMLIEIGNTIIIIEISEDNSIEIFLQNDRKVRRSIFDLAAAEGKLIKIGRNRSNHIPFSSDHSMSSYHSKIYYSNGNWIFQDINSLNGSWIMIKQKTLIQDLDVFKLGKNLLSYLCEIKTKGRFDRFWKNVKDNWTCIQCKTNLRNTYYLPCFHSCLCDQCSRHQENCRMCNVKIIQTIKFFT